MNHLDLADRQTRQAERELSRARWRAFRKLAPVAVMMGLGLSFSAAVVWLFINFVGGWGIGIPVAVMVAYAAGESYQFPERYQR